MNAETGNAGKEGRESGSSGKRKATLLDEEHIHGVETNDSVVKAKKTKPAISRKGAADEEEEGMKTANLS